MKRQRARDDDEVRSRRARGARDERRDAWGRSAPQESVGARDHTDARRKPTTLVVGGSRQYSTQTTSDSVVGTVVAGENLLYAANNERLFAIDRS
jgi:phage gp46-like protein